MIKVLNDPDLAGKSGSAVISNNHFGSNTAPLGLSGTAVNANNITT